MHDFNLESSVEFQKIKEIRKIIGGAAQGMQGGQLSPVHAAASLIVNRPDNEMEIVGDLSPRAVEGTPGGKESLNKELALFGKKKDLLALMARPELVSSAVVDFNSRLSKNIYSIFAVSNYAFADHIFRYECETEDLKKLRTGANEDPQAIPIRNLRRKAEESYKNGKFDEAIKFFGEAVAKYQGDFTIYYQLGLIYFFEKADFKNSMENFRLASKYAYNKYNPIFIHGMVFTGVLLKLFALHTKNADMLSEAYQAIYQAYAADTGYNFSKYALAQCSAAMTFRSDLVVQANSLIKNLIMSDKLFALQIIHDIAFNTYIDELEKLIKSMYEELLNNITRLFEKIDLSFDMISQNMQYIAIPARIASVKSEYKKSVEHISVKRTFFDADAVYAQSSRISGELEELVKEIERNRKYAETRALIESAIKSYREDFVELTGHYAQVEKRFIELKEQYIKLDSYYPNPEFFDIVSGLIYPDVLYNDPDKKLWRESGLFILIKVIAGGSTFLFLFITIVILATLFSTGIGSFFSIVSMLIALVFMPLYATVFAEIFYNMIEIKRRGLLADLRKFKADIDANKSKITEIDKKLSAKYIAYISEQGHLTPFTSEKMFEACLDGNFEQIKAMMPVS
jgi:hypothetical protein